MKLRSRIILSAGTVLCCCMGWISAIQLYPTKAVDNALYDYLVRRYAAHRRSAKTAIIDIDEKTLSAIGQWPWPRYRIASLIKILSDCRPKAIAMDILFSEPDNASLSTIKANFKREFGLDIDFTGLPSGLDDNDGYLGHVCGAAPTVGAVYYFFDMKNTTRPCMPQPVALSGLTERLSPHQASGILCNVPPVQNGLSASGFINTVSDADGVLRKLPLLLSFEGNMYPSLALATLMKVTGQHHMRVEEDIYGLRLRLDRITIPVDSSASAMLRFNGAARTHQTLSALDVLAGRIDPGMLADRYLFIGSSAAGINDLHYTPVDELFPGIEIHAVFVENSLARQFYREPIWRPFYAFISTLVAGMALSCFFLAAGPRAAALGTLAIMAGFLGISAAFLYSQGVYLPVSGVLLTTMVLLPLFSFVLYTIERRIAYLRLEKLSWTKQLTLEAMAAVAETRDPETGGHIKRTREYVRVLATHLAQSGNYPMLTPKYIDLLCQSAPLHDLGKVGIPDNILLKPGSLSEMEFATMKTHTTIGKAILSSIESTMGGVDFLTLAQEISATHHEKWDGSGYPLGLKGEKIPLSGRLMALADVYDALVSKRQYKSPFSHEKAKAIILQGRGIHFDPAIVDAFTEMERHFIQIKETYKDEDKLE